MLSNSGHSQFSPTLDNGVMFGTFDQSNFNSNISGNKMTLGVRPSLEKDKMSKTSNGQGGFFSPRTDAGSTRVSTVDNVQKRD